MVSVLCHFVGGPRDGELVMVDEAVARVGVVVPLEQDPEVMFAPLPGAPGARAQVVRYLPTGPKVGITFEDGHVELLQVEMRPA